MHSSDLNLQISRRVITAAYSVAYTSPSEHIAPILGQPCWLQLRLKFPGNACPCLSTITSFTPANLSDLLQLYSPSRPLHSRADTCLLQPHPAGTRRKVTVHSLIQVRLSGAHCQSTSEMQQTPVRSSQLSNSIFQPQTF